MLWIFHVPKCPLLVSAVSRPWTLRVCKLSAHMKRHNVTRTNASVLPWQFDSITREFLHCILNWVFPFLRHYLWDLLYKMHIVTFLWTLQNVFNVGGLYNWSLPLCQIEWNTHIWSKTDSVSSFFMQTL